MMDKRAADAAEFWGCEEVLASAMLAIADTLPSLTLPGSRMPVWARTIRWWNDLAQAHLEMRLNEEGDGVDYILSQGMGSRRTVMTFGEAVSWLRNMLKAAEE